ncbi:uncharacterized protein LOC123443673 isoform X1 [Hordeum vulgare subsp. vulgare]|uniref:uncharacterized protein LOC123443673 isoform X1 n=1 Tax=Hordeum vulgare subsp. vulgare TaxID=112509 RepID=UPI001D1A4CB2|nr:uncharacterized protein LOC123443673 isoform X1 [Hordeum vulgare subsp. vulgare]
MPSKVSQLEHVFIMGSRVRFMIISDMLKNAPMVKLLEARIRGKGSAIGVGRGRALAMRAMIVGQIVACSCPCNLLLGVGVLSFLLVIASLRWHLRQPFINILVQLSLQPSSSNLEPLCLTLYFMIPFINADMICCTLFGARNFSCFVSRLLVDQFY